MYNFVISKGFQKHLLNKLKPEAVKTGVRSNGRRLISELCLQMHDTSSFLLICSAWGVYLCVSLYKHHKNEMCSTGRVVLVASVFVFLSIYNLS